MAVAIIAKKNYCFGPRPIIRQTSRYGGLRLDYQGTTTDGRHANLAVQTPGTNSYNVAQILTPLNIAIPDVAIRQAFIESANHRMLVRLVIRPGVGFSG